MIRWVIAGQGAYYALTGLWPLAGLASFEAETGPKVDDWLVHMVGLLAAAVGAALLAGARRARPSGETVTLSCAAAAAFGAIDAAYVLRGVISPVYLADAAVQAVVLVAVAAGRPREAAR